MKNMRAMLVIEDLDKGTITKLYCDRFQRTKNFDMPDEKAKKIDLNESFKDYNNKHTDIIVMAVFSDFDPEWVKMNEQY